MRFPRLAERDRLIGKNLREFRLARGLTQKELGARMGLTMQQIHKYEKGENRMATSLSIAIAAELGVPLAILIDHNTEALPPALKIVVEFEAIPPGAIKTALHALVKALAPSTEEPK